jgi:hypothetical protein
MNSSERRTHWHLAADVDQYSFDLPSFKNFDLDRSLLRLHHRDDIAAFHAIARLDHPFDKGARFHVGAERWHAEFRHGISR